MLHSFSLYQNKKNQLNSTYTLFVTLFFFIEEQILRSVSDLSTDHLWTWNSHKAEIL
jgi:hypothetical protein